MDVPHDFGKISRLFEACGPIALLEQVTVPRLLAIDYSCMLAGEALDKSSEWDGRNLDCEVDLLSSPAERIDLHTASPYTALDEFAETLVIPGFRKDFPALVAVQNNVVNPTRYMKSSQACHPCLL
jgi:hypothetical protein